MYDYRIFLDGSQVAEDYNFDSYGEAESEAGFCIESLLQCGFEDDGYRFNDFEIIVEAK